jgi:hypothetical protein
MNYEPSPYTLPIFIESFYSLPANPIPANPVPANPIPANPIDNIKNWRSNEYVQFDNNNYFGKNNSVTEDILINIYNKCTHKYDTDYKNRNIGFEILPYNESYFKARCKYTNEYIAMKIDEEFRIILHSKDINQLKNYINNNFTNELEKKIYNNLLKILENNLSKYNTYNDFKYILYNQILITVMDILELTLSLSYMMESDKQFILIFINMNCFNDYSDLHLLNNYNESQTKYYNLLKTYMDSILYDYIYENEYIMDIHSKRILSMSIIIKYIITILIYLPSMESINILDESLKIYFTYIISKVCKQENIIRQYTNLNTSNINTSNIDDSIFHKINNTSNNLKYYYTDFYNNKNISYNKILLIRNDI